MRTGEVRDAELVSSIALPGVASALTIAIIAIPIAVALGQDVPVNAPLYVVGAVLTVGHALRLRLLDGGVDAERRVGAAHSACRSS